MGATPITLHHDRDDERVFALPKKFCYEINRTQPKVPSEIQMYMMIKAITNCGVMILDRRRGTITTSSDEASIRTLEAPR